MGQLLTTRLYIFLRDSIFRYRRIMVALLHLLQAAAANYFAFVLRFDGFISSTSNGSQWYLFLTYLPVLLVIRLVMYAGFGLYKDLWKYSSVRDLVKLVWTVLLGSVLFFVLVRLIAADPRYPRSIYVLDGLLLLMISGGTRLGFRVFREYLEKQVSSSKVLIIGAGDAGEMIVRDMLNNPRYKIEPIGFIDDAPHKKGMQIHGLPIFGPRERIAEVVMRHRPDEILIALPAMSTKVIREIYEFCKQFNLPVKTLPGLHDIVEGNVTVSHIRPLSLEDLLQREPIRTNIEEVSAQIKGKIVLVTGAGGSIGSELCRQIMQYGPAKLVLFDRYENGLFSIDMELRAAARRKAKGERNGSPSPLPPDGLIVTIVGDMRDVTSVNALFAEFRPQVVFHAAAHKHVPLMELNALEAVKNNIFGTRNLIQAASQYGTESFVTISTDKAVNPTNVMGATKRVTEFLGLSVNGSSSTKFTTVRFGNVLGSNGSVVHIFREQLQNGGPITVTHPDIKRFFMLIPEAVQLVLISAALGKGGDIYVLEMGAQIRIVELAENLIRLSGLVPYDDIQIEFTGLRPGEKLFEELFDETERITETPHEKIRAAIPTYIPSYDELQAHIKEFERIIKENAVDEVIPTLQKIVPNYRQNAAQVQCIP
ncbi:MAG: polysaccharide biosynthesis protein [Nitrospirae bacterium]|nr:polysaccharide biosynthesis protein [Nitrospirota bacterium]